MREENSQITLTFFYCDIQYIIIRWKLLDPHQQAVNIDHCVFKKAESVRGYLQLEDSLKAKYSLLQVAPKPSQKELSRECYLNSL